MASVVDSAQLIAQGLTPAQAEGMAPTINKLLAQAPEAAWQALARDILTPALPFSLHLFLFTTLFPLWQTAPTSAPAWLPDPVTAAHTHLATFMREQQCASVAEFHQWTTTSYFDFLNLLLTKLNIRFQQPPTAMGDLSKGIEFPTWLPQAKLNIVESCFNAPATATAIIYPDSRQGITSLTYGELASLSNRIANGLVELNFKPGDAIAIALPMTMEAVVIYLGIIKMGGVVVAIADSFSSEEIATRLQIAVSVAVFTQETTKRDGKLLPLYSKIIAANAPQAIVLPGMQAASEPYRAGDLCWENFLSDNVTFAAHPCSAMDPCNILFSSGTTGIPKAIPWNHGTAIKAASDAYLHHDIQTSDILCWPTNLGWMMGPWLIFAGLINQAAIAVYDDTPASNTFAKFIQQAKVTMLGVVPTLVSAWRHHNHLDNVDWQQLKCFSSTGECSNAQDMLYLMSRAHYRPIIEYCGGTEIGGSYLSSTLIQKNYPGLFSTAVMGVEVLILDEQGQPADTGEIAIVPPALGLSTTLLNADHHEVYFANMPASPAHKLLRRHGDQAHRYANGYYRILGRADDTMNLSGIKISAVEIERSLTGLADIIETAAVAVAPPQSGPSRLIIFAVTTSGIADKKTMQAAMQARINQHLSPLFKIYDIVFLTELPKTASNKILRRLLRKQYQTPYA
jgi:acetyl-CoA synthetase